MPIKNVAEKYSKAVGVAKNVAEKYSKAVGVAKNVVAKAANTKAAKTAAKAAVKTADIIDKAPKKNRMKKPLEFIKKHKVAIHAGVIGATGAGLAVAGRARLQKLKKKEEKMK